MEKNNAQYCMEPFSFSLVSTYRIQLRRPYNAKLGDRCDLRSYYYRSGILDDSCAFGGEPCGKSQEGLSVFISSRLMDILCEKDMSKPSCDMKACFN